MSLLIQLSIFGAQFKRLPSLQAAVGSEKGSKQTSWSVYA